MFRKHTILRAVLCILCTKTKYTQPMEINAYLYRHTEQNTLQRKYVQRIFYEIL